MLKIEHNDVSDVIYQHVIKIAPAPKLLKNVVVTFIDLMRIWTHLKCKQISKVSIYVRV